MTTTSDPTAATARRPWYRSIAGKLLLAFALIAALTVSASWLSLFRFNEIDAAMDRLTGVSLPLVELSLGVESKAAELVVLATQVGNAEDETQRFERMDRLSDQIGHLWSTLGNLQSIISEEAAAARLQELVAAINTKVGELDRSTREVLVLRGRKDRAVAQAVAVNEMGMRSLLQITDDMLARMAGDLDRAGAGEPNVAGLQQDLHLLRAAYATRADFVRITTLLTDIAAAMHSDALPGFREQVAAAADTLSRDLAIVTADPALDRTRSDELRAAAQSLISLGSGDDGLLSIQAKLLPERQAVADNQTALQTIGVTLRSQVANLSERAEREATDTVALSTDPIQQSRLWPLLIAAP